SIHITLPETIGGRRGLPCGMVVDPGWLRPVESLGYDVRGPDERHFYRCCLGDGWLRPEPDSKLDLSGRRGDKPESSDGRIAMWGQLWVLFELIVVSGGARSTLSLRGVGRRDAVTAERLGYRLGKTFCATWLCRLRAEG